MMTHDEQIRKDLTSIGEYADHRMAISKLQGNCEGLTWAYELCREATSLDNAVKLIAGTITTYATKLQSAIDAAHKRLHADLKAICIEQHGRPRPELIGEAMRAHGAGEETQ